MSEKTYYVKLKNTYKHEEKRLSLNKVSGNTDLLGREHSGAWWKGTKKELAEIMDGAIYKQSIFLPFDWLGSAESLKEKLGWEFNKAIDKWEYTNLLVELVPLEVEG